MINGCDTKIFFVGFDKLRLCARGEYVCTTTISLIDTDYSGIVCRACREGACRNPVNLLSTVRVVSPLLLHWSTIS